MSKYFISGMYNLVFIFLLLEKCEIKDLAMLDGLFLDLFYIEVSLLGCVLKILCLVVTT